jgi:hypothetical protein
MRVGRRAGGGSAAASASLAPPPPLSLPPSLPDDPVPAKKAVEDPSPGPREIFVEGVPPPLHELDLERPLHLGRAQLSVGLQEGVARQDQELRGGEGEKGEAEAPEPPSPIPLAFPQVGNPLVVLLRLPFPFIRRSPLVFPYPGYLKILPSLPLSLPPSLPSSPLFSPPAARYLPQLGRHGQGRGLLVSNHLPRAYGPLNRCLDRVEACGDLLHTLVHVPQRLHGGPLHHVHYAKSSHPAYARQSRVPRQMNGACPAQAVPHKDHVEWFSTYSCIACPSSSSEGKPGL